MAWSSGRSNRSLTLPPNWAKLRLQRFALDGYRCTFRAADGTRCKAVPTDCDHIDDRLDHDLSNLTSLCSFHHRRKTAVQGREARMKNREEIMNRFRRVEP